MIDKQKYFDALFQYLNDSKLLPITDQSQWRVDFQRYFDAAEIDRSIISKIKEQYDIGFENVFLINCRKCALLCEHFGIRKNKQLIQTSVYFTVLGCLLDWLLDHGDAKQMLEAKQKLKWSYCGDYFCKNTNAKENSGIDLLYEKISTGMITILRNDQKRFQYIIELVRLAIDSELAVCTKDVKLFYENIILNKSVLFVQIAAEILLSEKEEMTSSDRKLVEDLGYAFALIDDLCDLYEDMETGQMNLLMKYDINTDNYEFVIKSVISELIAKLQIMQARFDGRLYEFILQEIREWSMSNTELRKRIWCING